MTVVKFLSPRLDRAVPRDNLGESYDQGASGRAWGNQGVRVPGEVSILFTKTPDGEVGTENSRARAR